MKCRRGRRRIHTWPSRILVMLMTVCREPLWHKMRQYGVEEKFVRVCKVLYSGVETRMVLNRGKSRLFAVNRGLRQGTPLSPLLFNIYLMGIAEELERTQLGVKF